MAFLNKLFKPKKKQDAREKFDAAGLDTASAPRQEETQGMRAQKQAQAIGGIVLLPRVTEKASASTSRGQYVFVIDRAVNKIQVRRAVEKQYNVHVQNVRVINLPPKKRMRGKQIGWKPGIKKAIVKVREGEKIEVQ